MPRIPATQRPPYPVSRSASEPDDADLTVRTVDAANRPRGPPDGRKLLDRDALISKGISYSRPHLWKLVEAGKFPRPIKIGRINFWVEAEVNAHIDRLITDRDRKVKAA